jgi:hypothetical protein
VSSPPLRAAPVRHHGRVRALWGVSVGISAAWALAGALLCAATYGMSLAPPVSPGNSGPLPWPDGSWVPVFWLASLGSLALAPSPIVALITGRSWLRRAGLIGWRWQAAWAGSSAAALAAEALLVRAVTVAFWYTRGSALRQPNWGPPALAATFIAAGAAMITTLAIAASASADVPPGQTAAVA